ncbi:hypothetical protein EPO15_13280 [bacterium]|nr:MAG: hypothetical protein EPO15_13280 [bacterium]
MHGQDAFNAAFFGFLDRLFLIASFGEVAAIGMPAAEMVVAPKYASLAEGLLKGREFAALAAKPGALQAPALPAGWVEKAVKLAMDRAKPTVDASCFIYAHTLLEALAVDYAAALGKPFPRNGSAASAAKGLAKVCPGSEAPDLKLLAGLDSRREGAVRGEPVPDAETAVASVLEAALAMTKAAAGAGGFRLDPGWLVTAARKPKRR